MFLRAWGVTVPPLNERTGVISQKARNHVHQKDLYGGSAHKPCQQLLTQGKRYSCKSETAKTVG